MDKGFRRYEITPMNSEMYSLERTVVKHFPQFNEVKSWLDEYCWEIEELYGNYEKQSFNEKTNGNRAIIWAKRK